MGDVALGFSDAINRSPFANWAEYTRQREADDRQARESASILEERKANRAQITLEFEENRRRYLAEEGKRKAEYEEARAKADMAMLDAEDHPNSIELKNNATKAGINANNAATAYHEANRKRVEQEMEYARIDRPGDVEATQTSRKNKEESEALQLEELRRNAAAAKQASADAARLAVPNALAERLANYDPGFQQALKAEATADQTRLGILSGPLVALRTNTDTGETIYETSKARETRANDNYNSIMRGYEPYLEAIRRLREWSATTPGVTADTIRTMPAAEFETLYKKFLPAASTGIGIVKDPKTRFSITEVNPKIDPPGKQRKPGKARTRTQWDTPAIGSIPYPEDVSNPLRLAQYAGAAVWNPFERLIGNVFSGTGVAADYLTGGFSDGGTAPVTRALSPQLFRDSVTPRFSPEEQQQLRQTLIREAQQREQVEQLRLALSLLNGPRTIPPR